jgi:hypothetical protein
LEEVNENTGGKVVGAATVVAAEGKENLVI